MGCGNASADDLALLVESPSREPCVLIAGVTGFYLAASSLWLCHVFRFVVPSVPINCGGCVGSPLVTFSTVDRSTTRPLESIVYTYGSLGWSVWSESRVLPHLSSHAMYWDRGS